MDDSCVFPFIHTERPMGPAYLQAREPLKLARVSWLWQMHVSLAEGICKLCGVQRGSGLLPRMPYHEQTHATVLAINLPGKTSQQYVTEVHHLVTFGLGDFSVCLPSSPAGDSRLEMSRLLQRQRERGLSQVVALPTPCKGHVCILAQ